MVVGEDMSQCSRTLFAVYVFIFSICKLVAFQRIKDANNDMFTDSMVYYSVTIVTAIVIIIMVLSDCVFSIKVASYNQDKRSSLISFGACFLLFVIAMVLIIFILVYGFVTKTEFGIMGLDDESRIEAEIKVCLL